MPLVYAGIDEAGYGPLLGPLCVGMAVVRVEDWSPGQGPPDLWSMLGRAVCRELRDHRGRIPIADSKRLKLSNSSRTKHPLKHLERGVLAFLSRLIPEPLVTDAALFEALGARLADDPWYRSSERTIPVGGDSDEIRIDGALLGRACAESGVAIASMRCEMVWEGEFNDLVERTGTKAEAVLVAITRHLGTLVGSMQDRASRGDPIKVICDRLGGRTGYGQFLARAFDVEPGHVLEVERSPRVSAYRVLTRAGEIAVQFRPEGESSHLPVALASMVAKYARELAMARFNDYWSGLDRSLKPTAGYRGDASRWLRDAAALLTDADRRSIVRRA